MDIQKQRSQLYHRLQQPTNRARYLHLLNAGQKNGAEQRLYNTLAQYNRFVEMLQYDPTMDSAEARLLWERCVSLQTSIAEQMDTLGWD